MGNPALSFPDGILGREDCKMMENHGRREDRLWNTVKTF